MTHTQQLINQIDNPDKWAMVELVGYQIFTGIVSDQTIDGKQYIRLDVPATKVHPAFDCKFGIDSIQRIHPITEDKAKEILKQRELGRFAKNYDQIYNLYK